MKQKAPKKLSLDVSADVSSRLRQFAKKNDCSVTLVVRYLLNTYLPEIEKRGLFNNLLEVK
jgi:hypothetical protein